MMKGDHWPCDHCLIFTCLMTMDSVLAGGNTSLSKVFFRPLHNSLKQVMNVDLDIKKLKLPTVCDDQLLCGRASLCAKCSHLLHHIHAISNPAKSHMLEVQVFGFLQGDEEL